MPEGRHSEPSFNWQSCSLILKFFPQSRFSFMIFFFTQFRLQSCFILFSARQSWEWGWIPCQKLPKMIWTVLLINYKSMWRVNLHKQASLYFLNSSFNRSVWILPRDKRNQVYDMVYVKCIIELKKFWRGQWYWSLILRRTPHMILGFYMWSKFISELKLYCLNVW